MSELHKFIFEGLPVRGAIVRLDEGWKEVLSRRALHVDEETGLSSYPSSVRNLLGDMTAAAVLMQSNIKWQGSLILQILGAEKSELEANDLIDNSPVKLVVAEVRSDLAFRVTAKVSREVTGNERFSELINASGHAKCAITLMPESRLQGQTPYQGIVNLGDATKANGERHLFESFAEVLEHYMLQSEQLDTKLVLAANGDIATGILIQRMPGVDGKANEEGIGDNEDFNRLALLATSLKREELLTLGIDDILHRLFWNEPLARYPAAEPAPRFYCTCSRERVANTIKSLGQTEAERMIEEREGIAVNCEFCGQRFSFDAIDAAMLFMPETAQTFALPTKTLQ